MVYSRLSCALKSCLGGGDGQAYHTLGVGARRVGYQTVSFLTGLEEGGKISIKDRDAVVVGVYPRTVDQVSLTVQYTLQATRRNGGSEQERHRR